MLNDSEINFRNLAHEVNAGIFVCDLKGRFIYANLALAKILGFERPSEIIGKHFEDFISPVRKETFLNQFRKSITDPKITVKIIEELEGQDNKKVIVEIFPMAFFKNNNLVGSQGVVHDISENRQSEKDLMYAATHDSVTGIYNRTFFEAELNRLEKGRQYPISLIFILTEVINKDGSAVKPKTIDRLMKQTARKLFFTFRGDDIVARVGEDAFAILLPNVEEDTLDMLTGRVRSNLDEIEIAENDPALEFYIGACNAKNSEKLKSAFNQARAIADLERKKQKSA